MRLYKREDFTEGLNDVLPNNIKVNKIYNRRGHEVEQVPNADFGLVDLKDTKDGSDGFTLDYNAIKRFYGGRK